MSAALEEDLRHLERRRLRSLVEVNVVDGALAVLRYRSAIDCYRRADAGAGWRVRWSQATSITNA